jgi:hypothetical protein
LKVAAIVVFLITTPRLAAIDFYASPTGTTATGPGTGTISNPWDLQTALSHPGAVQPGDTIWLLGGTYTGNFTSSLKGTARAPIVVRQYPGERATLDGNVNSSVLGTNQWVLMVKGGYTWYWGFEVTDSNPNRNNPTPGSNPVDVRNPGVGVLGPGTKIINLVIHDTGQGMSPTSIATDSEYYGNIIYYNGWNAPDRGHGHGIYAQNGSGGSKLIKHNVMFNQFGGYSIHAYGSKLAAFQNSTIAENVAIRDAILIGGSGGFKISGSQLVGNYSWEAGAVVGYYSQAYDPFLARNNYLVRRSADTFTPPSLINGARTGFTLTGNTIVGYLDGFSASDYPDNTYYLSTSHGVGPVPATNRVAVLPNAYEPGRATVVVYNWEGSATQAVDLTGVVSPGAAYEIRNARNFLGPPLASGVFSGSQVLLPLTGLPAAVPVGATAPPEWPEGFQSFVVLPPGGTFVATRVFPVILDAVGPNGAHFSTEITLANSGVTPASISLTYTASPQFGGPSGTVTDNLAPGRQLVVPDAISYLRSRGLPLGSGNQGGSLSVTFTGLSSQEASYAAARITSPSGAGRAGTAFASVRLEDGFDGKAIVFGLRQSDRERCNLALVNLASAGSITLALTAFSGGADGRTAKLAPVTLGAGEWIQVNSPLAAAGFDNGFIAVERIAGTGRFFTYGVVNDNITNDGALIPPVQDGTPHEDQILPVIVESGTFDSDLVLTNPGSQPVRATLSYVESLASPAGAVPFRTDIALGGFEQRLIPSAIDFLRQRGLDIGARGGESHAGAVGVQFSRDGIPAQGFAGVLTATPAPQGGRYGLFYNGIPVSHAAAGDAWVYGLQQDDTSRSNLAVASAGDAGEPVTCRLEVYDGDTGRLAGQLGPFIVPSRGWLQFPSVLAGFGVSNGYVRVVGTTGADHLVVYGVVNDGGTPLSGGTNDGSYIPSPAN